MLRNNYDGDVITWSPQGRLFQIEYAMQAVNLGTATLGLKSEEFAVLVALHKPSNELTISQPKIISIDGHVGMCIAGVSSDARQLGTYLRTECTAYSHSYNTIYPIGRLASNLGNRMQQNTQHYGRRPFGVGLILAGYDEKGSHIFQVLPSANVMNCKAMAMGYRYQGAHTYLCRFETTFPSCSKDQLICHGIQAINNTIHAEDKLNVSIAVVGKDHPFKILSNEEVQFYLNMCNLPSYPDNSQNPNNPENPVTPDPNPVVPPNNFDDIL